MCDGWTDGPTDGRTDIPSYRDARTHLKRYAEAQRKAGYRKKVLQSYNNFFNTKEERILDDLEQLTSRLGWLKKVVRKKKSSFYDFWFCLRGRPCQLRGEERGGWMEMSLDPFDSRETSMIV